MTMKQEQQKYEDIIDKAHPVSKKHPPMDRLARAAQFAPFAALTGHKEEISETSRLTEDRRLLDEHRKAYLDEQVQQIQQCIKTHPLVELTYFEEDEKKDGGAYCRIVKRIKEIDEYHRMFTFMDKTKIAMDTIYELNLVDEEENL